MRSAKKHGPKCCQFDSLNPNQENLSEDCLYLNVYTPQVNPSHPLPVMVWIHGGSFICESGDDDYYGPEFLVRKDIVLVTLNYRLGAFGFLCFHTAGIPGNAGMKDQVTAMKWVKTNIHSFGGDPDNITIFGESAGAGSIGFHLISPMTRGLFHRAIVQSGAASCWWSQDFESRDRTFLLAKQLGCFSEDDKVVEDFLKKQPAAGLVNFKLSISKSQKIYELPFGIADEKDFGQERFFYGDVTEVLRNGVHEGVEIMTGYTKDEGIVALAFGDSFESMMNEAKYFNEFFVPLWLRTHCMIADQLRVGSKMRQFYFKGGEITEESILKFLRMQLFSYGIILAGNFYSINNKVYFYKFTCMSDRNIYASAMGVLECLQNKSVVCHGDDLAYLFPVKNLSSKVDQESESFKLINTVTQLWTNFAKYG